MERPCCRWARLLPAVAVGGALTAACLVLLGQQPATNAPGTNLPGTNGIPPAQRAEAAFDPFERATLPVDLSSPEVKSNMPIREISPGIYELGDVRIDKEQRTVSFPARLNLDQGPMEYFLVASWGKTHESILKTDTEPFRIHLAMLLLDTNAAVAGAATNGPPVAMGGFVSHPSKERLPGEAVSIELKWTAGGKETRKRAEELIFNTEQNSVMRAGDWVYTGSRVVEGLFLAEIDGSIVSLVTDAECLINNEGSGHDNDTIWLANTNSLPPTNTPVTVSIKLKSPTGK
ncbi:MAG TPA: YdjY domain-containing protein [Candidatus Acidoferrum sp.]|nr:YdjY domain-containing protein [Candidatus Acidoferrum sp.]